LFKRPTGGQPIEKVMIGKRLVENDVDRVVLIGDALIGNAEIENWMIGSANRTCQAFIQNADRS
jgi:hypothetical protein